MPEGHTLHRIAKTHRPWLVGECVQVSSPQGRFEAGARLLDGQQIVAVEAWGKHLFYQFSSDSRLHVHLGLYGKFRDSKPPAPDPRGAVRVRLVSNKRCIDLNGPNQCHVIEPEEYRAILSRLGPDPLRAECTVRPFLANISNTRRSIGAALMDQKVVAGIGNIYRSEILFKLGIAPQTPCRDLQHSDLKRIWQLARRWMKVGVQKGRILTWQADQSASRTHSSDQERFYVYKRERCAVCASKIATCELAARRVYYCPDCQIPVMDS